MSRIGKQPITLPSGVTCEIQKQVINVKGPLGTDSCKVCDGLNLKLEDNILLIENSEGENKSLSAMHGLFRSLIANIVTGVSTGFSKNLEINGVGYRVQQQGKDLQLHLGFSHPVEYKAPDGITLEATDLTKITIKGIDKQKVGQVAAEIRKFRPPEPYKGKGIKYSDEIIRRKAGKAGK
jgi:large subunit ribosomal protein L6